MSDVAKDIILMFANERVMSMNFDTGSYIVDNERYLPYPLRGRIVRTPEPTGNIKYDISQMFIAANKSRDATVSWLANRTLSLSRANAKWIYNELGFNQVNTPTERLKIAIVCRAVSVLDKYWLKLDGSTTTWDNVDLKRNKLNEIIAQIALHGKSLTFQGSYTTPELTTNGVYAKAWRRHDDGMLWLYKLGNNGNFESKVEVMVSNLLDKMNVNHVKYTSGMDEGKYVCMCPCMSTEDLSILPAMEYYSYCNSNGLNFDKEVRRIDPEGFYKMCIIDYLISNRDRHLQNWGFYMDNSTFDIVSLHPLFDHNNAFDVGWMQNIDAKYQVTGKSIRESAKEAMVKVDFRFTDKIYRNDFITERQYESFVWRAKDLGLL